MAVYLIQGLLGVPLEDMYLDLEVSIFCYSMTNLRKNLDGRLTFFRQFKGDTIHAQIESFVLSLGFTSEDIGRFRDLMLK